MELFTYLENLTEKKIPFDSKNDDMVKGYNPYIINRFISMCESFIPLANEINKYPNLSKETHYNFYLSTLPKRKAYFKYIKKDKDLTEEEVEYVAEYFNITTREAKGHIKILDKESINTIIKKYRYGQSKTQEVS